MLPLRYSFHRMLPPIVPSLSTSIHHVFATRGLRVGIGLTCPPDRVEDLRLLFLCCANSLALQVAGKIKGLAHRGGGAISCEVSIFVTQGLVPSESGFADVLEFFCGRVAFSQCTRVQHVSQGGGVSKT